MHAIKTSFLYLNWFLVNRTYKRPNVNIVRYLCSNDLLNVYLESGISGFISKIDAKKNHHFLRLKLDNQEVGANFLRLYSNELGLFLNALSNEKLSTLVRLFKLIKEQKFDRK